MAEQKNITVSKTVQQKRGNYRSILWLVLGVICVVGIGAAVATIFHKGSNNASVNSKLTAVSKPNTTCGQVIKDIGGVDTSSVTNVKQKEELLERQQICYADQLDFDKAITAASALKQVYIGQNDSQNTERMTKRINDLYAAKTEFSNKAKANDDSSQ